MSDGKRVHTCPHPASSLPQDSPSTHEWQRRCLDCGAVTSSWTYEWLREWARHDPRGAELVPESLKYPKATS